MDRWLFGQSASARSVRGDIVFVDVQRLKQLLEREEWDVNTMVSCEPAYPQGFKQTLLWFSVVFGEPEATRLLLSVSAVPRQASRKTLDDALQCPQPDQECLNLIREAALIRDLEIDGARALADRNRLESELKVLQSRIRETELKLGGAASRLEILLNKAETEMDSKRIEISRLEARAASHVDNITELNQVIQVSGKSIKIAMKEVGDAEKVLNLAQQKLKAATAEYDEAQQSKAKVQAKLESTQTSLDGHKAVVGNLEERATIYRERLQQERQLGAGSSMQSRDVPRTDASPSSVLECSICMQRRVQRVFQCGHVSCSVCSEEIVKTGRCHVCRAAITHVNPLFVGE